VKKIVKATFVLSLNPTQFRKPSPLLGRVCGLNYYYYYGKLYYDENNTQ